MIRTQILLTPILKQQLTKVSEELNISFSETIRVLLEKSLKTIRKKKTPSQGLWRMADKAGRGPKDLSTNDEYLYKI